MAEEEDAPEPESPEALVTRSMASAHAWVVGLVSSSAILVGLVGIYAIEHHRGADIAIAIGVTALVLALVCGGISQGILARARMSTARLLLAKGHYDPAMHLLKALAKNANVGDEATYSIALVYDRQGKTRLAEAGYKAYLSAFEEEGGSWAMEAQVRVEELGATVAAPVPVVQAQAVPAKPDLRCPFCKDTFIEDAVTAECADCATAHHLACYEEQGGCSVYGCRSSTLKTRLRD